MTTPHASLTVRFNPTGTWASLLGGVIGFVLALLLPVLGGSTPLLLLLGTALLALVGVFRLIREYFTYTWGPDTQTIDLARPLAKSRRFVARGGDRFVPDGGRIFLVEESGRRTNLRIYRYQADRSDWDAFLAALRK